MDWDLWQWKPLYQRNVFWLLLHGRRWILHPFLRAPVWRISEGLASAILWYLGGFFVGSMITKQWISVDLGWSFNTSGDFMNVKLSISPKWPEVWSTSSQRLQGGRRGGHWDFGCTYWWSSKQLGMATWIGGSSWEDLKLQEMGRIFTTQSWL